MRHRVAVGFLALQVFRACAEDATAVLSSCQGADASSPCCEAHKAWAKAEASGNCGGQGGGGVVADASLCSSAEQLCKECQKLQSTQIPSLNASAGLATPGSTESEGLLLTSLTPDKLQMRCVPSSLQDDCKMKDMTVFMVFLAGTILVILLVSVTVMFDLSCLPSIVRRLARSLSAPLPDPDAAISSTPALRPALSPSPVPPHPEAAPEANGSPFKNGLRHAASADAVPAVPHGDPVVGMKMLDELRPPKRKPPPPLDEEVEPPTPSQSIKAICSYGDVMDPYGASPSSAIAIGLPVMGALGFPPKLKLDSIGRDRQKGHARWPARLARLWALRIAFLYVTAAAVFARLVHITLTAAIAVSKRSALTVTLEFAGCLVPYAWCALTSRPPTDPREGLPHHVGFFCWRLPRFATFVLVTLILEIYSATATAWAVTTASCDTTPWRPVLLYCLGIPVIVARTYSALLAIRLQDGVAHANRRVLPMSDPRDKKHRSHNTNFSLTFTDIGSAELDVEAEVSSGECRLRTPNGTARCSEDTKPRDKLSGASCAKRKRDSFCCFRRLCCAQPLLAEDKVVMGPPSPMASPCSSQAAMPTTISGRLRRCLRVRSTAAIVLSLGLFLVLAAATASVWAFHASRGKEVQKEKLPSSCVTAQNGTATCAHFESVGDHMWDSSVNDLVSGTADTQEDCCRGCDELGDCQGWMFEHMAKSCRWIRFLEEPCQTSPGDLSCRCVTHFGTTFGFKPTSQIVWVKREGLSSSPP